MPKSLYQVEVGSVVLIALLLAAIVGLLAVLMWRRRALQRPPDANVQSRINLLQHRIGKLEKMKKESKDAEQR